MPGADPGFLAAKCEESSLQTDEEKKSANHNLATNEFPTNTQRTGHDTQLLRFPVAVTKKFVTMATWPKYTCVVKPSKWSPNFCSKSFRFSVYFVQDARFWTFSARDESQSRPFLLIPQQVHIWVWFEEDSWWGKGATHWSVLILNISGTSRPLHPQHENPTVAYTAGGHKPCG